MMAEIKITVHAMGNKNYLHLKDVSEELIGKITENFFTSSGCSPIRDDNPFTPSFMKCGNLAIEAVEPGKDKPVAIKQLPIINGQRSLSVSIGDILSENAVDRSNKPNEPNQENGEEPDYYKTGIKVEEDGTKRYKCRYFCSCGAKGNHYVPLKTEEVLCHECFNSLAVSLSMGEVNAQGIPERDNYGNFFTAKPYTIQAKGGRKK